VTLKEARKILKSPLIFGDPQQIKAVRFIEAVDEAVERLKDDKFLSHGPRVPEDVMLAARRRLNYRRDDDD
jgi:superfamily I DNA and/or RNA helicase